MMLREPAGLFAGSRGRPGRVSLGVVAVFALVILVAVAVYGVSEVAKSGGASDRPPVGGAPDGAKSDESVLNASGVLRDAEPLILAGRWPEAIVLLEKGVESFGEERDLRLALARALGGQKEWTRSLQQFEAALEIGPETAALNAEAATTANVAGKLDRAIELFSRAKQLEPSNPRHPLYLAMVQLKVGSAEREREAMVNLIAATVLDPDLAEAWGVMGEIALKNNQLGMAEQHLEKARILQPESLKWRLAQAKVFKRLNRPADSLDCLLNLPDAQRFDARVVPVIADSLRMLKQETKRGDFLEAAAVFAKRHGDEALAAVIDGLPR